MTKIATMMVRVSEKNHRRVKRLGVFGEIYDDIIGRMLDYVEENEEDFNQATIEEDTDNEEDSE